MADARDEQGCADKLVEIRTCWDRSEHCFAGGY